MTTKEKTREGAGGNPSRYMRAPEAAAYLRVGRRTLSRWQCEGKVAFVRAGRKLILFRRADLDRAMDRLLIREIL